LIEGTLMSIPTIQAGTRYRLLDIHDGDVETIYTEDRHSVLETFAITKSLTTTRGDEGLAYG
jgi:hypothetical protein